MNSLTAIFGSAPGAGVPDKFKIALLRAVRTLLQGTAGAFPAAGAGMSILDTTYWETFGYSVLAAGIAAVVSLLQNIASFLPEDPTQKKPAE